MCTKVEIRNLLIKIFVSPFFLAPIIALIMGNFSLGMIAAGLTVLIWGYKEGVNFITLTTVFLVILTGNISFEIIFIYCFTAAVLVQEEIIFKKFDNDLSYLILGFISIIFYPLWSVLLGLIPVSLLNEFNIAGQLFIIAGLLLTLFRIREIIDEKASFYIFLDYMLVFITAVLGIIASVLMLLVWPVGSVLLKKFKNDKNCRILISKMSYNVIGYIMVIAAAYFLLPISFFFSAVVILFFSFVLRHQKEIPLVEMVYISLLIGLLAGRIGLLQ